MLVGSAYGKVGLDVSGVQSGVNQAASSLENLQSMAGQIGGAMQSAGAALTVGVSLPLIAAGAAAVKMASDLNETKSKVSVIFGDMSKDMMDWAETANTSLGQTRAQALDAASTFALFGKAAGKSGQDLNKFAQQNVSFAADFASFYNTNPEEAIQAIGAAYRGESEPIRKYNILLNDQIIKQKAATLGLYAGSGALTQQARIMAVNSIIAEQGSAAMGDFARTSGGLANQSRILSAQLKDSLAMLGQNLLPMVVSVVGGLNQFLTTFQKMPVPVQQFILVLAGLLIALGPVLSVLGWLIQVAAAFSTAWPAVTAAVAGSGPAFAGLGAVITGTAVPALGAVVAAALPIIAAVALVGAAIFLLYAAFSTNFMGITDTARTLVWMMQDYFASLGETIKGLVKIVSFYMGKVRDGIFNAFKLDWGQIGRNIIMGIANGIINGISAVIAATKRAAEASLQAFKDALGIHSPSVKFDYLGKMSGLGYMQGLQRQIDPAQLARMIARPIQTSSSQVINQSQTTNIGNSFSISQARQMQKQSEKNAINGMANLIGAR